MQQLIEWTTYLRNFMWGNWMILLLLGTGLLLSIRTGFIQFRHIGTSFKQMFRGAFRKDKSEKEQGDIRPFQALATALSGTVGNGNIAGVATAIFWGGPGAIVWMWATAFVGMSTKYCEAVLALKYREVEEDGTMAGGPMYYFKNGLKNKKLGKIFAAVFASAGAFSCLFGTGNMVQSNSMALAFKSEFNIPFWITGGVVTILAGLVIIGGIKRIGAVTERLVPAMIILYFLGAFAIIMANIVNIPAAFALIFKSAFTGKAATGGFMGAMVREVISRGVSRGLLSNEAGMGSAPIAYSAAKAKTPVSMGVIAIAEVFIDTIIVCSLTALAIILSGQWTSGLDSTALTASAFNSVIPHGGAIVALGSALFGFSTLIAWAYYGEQCLEYIFGLKITKIYRVMFVCLIFLGSVLQQKNLIIVWNIGDFANALMSIPNLIALILLSGVIARATKEFYQKPEKFF
jgi:AGCS family alanine or glycine:cation symporter